MNRRVLLTLVLLFSMAWAAVSFGEERREQGNLVFEGIEPTPADLRARLLQYQNTRGHAFADWHPKGTSLLVRTRFGETAQIHEIRSPLGARKQLTFFDEPVRGGAFQPKSSGERFVFVKDTGGDEYYQVFAFDSRSGKAERISDGVERKGGVLWSEDGSQLAWYTTVKDSATRRIVVADASDPTKTKTTVFEGDGYWQPMAFSPSGTHLLIYNYVSIRESSLHLVELANNKAKQVDPRSERTAYSTAHFDPSGKHLYFITDAGSEFGNLVRYDLASGRSESLTDDIQWDVSDFDISPDGSTLALSLNEGGLNRLVLRSAKDNAELPSPKLPVGLIAGLKFSPDSKQLGMTLNTAASPSDVYVYSLAGRKLTRWTEAEVGGLDTADFVLPELIEFETFDEVNSSPRRVPAFYYKPQGHKGPRPVVISIHGGPEAQFRPWFRSAYQYWLRELGVAILAPNVRGSSGYGKTYVELDNGFNREDSVKDIGKLIEWVRARPEEFDSNRIVVFGGSYGGYMVYAAMTHYADWLAGGVDIVGISNFVTFLKNTKTYRRDLRRAEYGDERDPKMLAFLEKISPLNDAAKITKPMLIIQGANDPRVPASEAEQMLAAIRSNGQKAWYLLAKDEGHGFRKKGNRDAMTEAVVLFLSYVLGVD